MTSFEFVGFFLDNGMQVDGTSLVLATIVETNLPATTALFPSKMVYKFSLGLLGMLRNILPTCNKSTSYGNKCPTI